MTDQPKQERIAIIGMAGRFPDAETLDSFWANLRSGHESLREFSDDELTQSGVPAFLLADPAFVKRGTVLDGADLFDAGFFGYTPREAAGMDPQHRVFLECAWEALEDAGHLGAASAESIGVFAGASMNSYIFANLLRNTEAQAALGGYQIMLANDKDFLATRVSYKLNLRGPSLTVQTACSTSLVAVQLACEQLLAGKCDVALAGGVSLSFPEKQGYLYTEGMILSRDGRCRPFDSEASGTRGSAGAGIVVLRRLSDALRNGDQIRAVICGAAINNDGARKIGYTAPSVEGQAEAIRAAQASAGFHPDSISYIEAHGTGTRVGDPIEIAGLSRVFQERTERRQFCAIGSLKGNLGHLDAAAGVAGLIKTVLALENEALPPTVNFSQPNPQIDFENSPFFVNDQLSPWPRTEAPRRAGVSSFGIGGTNAHVVLEEAPLPEPSRTSRKASLLTLSAQSAAGLSKASEALAAHLERNPGLDLAAVSFTQHVGRRRFAYRRSVVAEDHGQAITALRQAPRATAGAKDAPPVMFLLSGQGSQYTGMARGLFETEPVFQKHFLRCCEIAQTHLGYDLREIVFEHSDKSASNGSSGAHTIDQTRFAQPALLAVEYALAQLWMSWGVTPQAMIGHSLGEYTAACLAGVFTLEDALAVVSERGRLMQSMPAGSMLAVHLPADQIARTGIPVSLAAVNTQNLCTVSGTHEAIGELEGLLHAQGIHCRRLRTSHAFHSEMMEPVLAPFREFLSRIKMEPPRIPFASNLTGAWIRPEEATDPQYWADQLRHGVRFADGLRTLTRDAAPILLEIGPGDVLSTFAKQNEGVTAADVVNTLPHPQDPQPDAAYCLKALGRVWEAGAEIDWQGFHAGESVRRVSLPTYPFERQRCWIEPKAAAAAETWLNKQSDLADWFYTPSWTRTLLPSKMPGTASEPRHWILFLGDNAVSTALQGEAQQSGQTVWTVRQGEGFRRLDETTFFIDPSSPQDYARLIDAVTSANAGRPAFLHLWNVTGQTAGSETSAFYSPLYLAQAIADRMDFPVADVLFVSDGLHGIGEADRIDPVKSLLLGPTRIAPNEIPRIAARAVDLPSGVNDEQAARFARELLREPACRRNRRVLAYRDGACWEETWEPLRLERAEPDLLESRGVYLITGGMGGIGLVLARHLAEKFQARLILTTRSAFPERAAWNDWLATHIETNETSKRIRELLEVERLGGEVMVASADVSDQAAMRMVVRQAREQFGAIDGVIHAAGTVGGEILQLKTRQTTASVLNPKVAGTEALFAALEGQLPRFVVLCSSISAIVPSPGLVDYCSANAYLDAWAASAEGPRIISINWDSWSDVGMASRLEGHRDTADARRMLQAIGIGSNDGIEAFLRALSAGLPRIAVITRRLPQMLAEIADKERRATEAAVAVVTSAPEVIVEEVAVENGLTEAQAGVLRIWKELLGVAELGLDDNFFSLGGHSLLATAILARIRRDLGVTLELRSIFDSPTVRQLADRVDAIRWVQTTAERPVEELQEEEREEIEL